MAEIRHTIERSRMSGTGQLVAHAVSLVYDPALTQTVVIHGGVIAEPIPRWVLEASIEDAVEVAGKIRSYAGRPLLAGAVEIQITERVSAGLATVTATMNRAAVKAFLKACAAEDEWARIELATAGAS